jgi:hypothetical protein
MKMYIYYPCPFSNGFRSCSVQENNSAFLQIILLRMQTTFPPILWSCQSLRFVSKNCGFQFALDGKAEMERSHGQLKVSDRLHGNRHELRTALAQRIKGQIGNWLEFVSSINARSSGLETDPARHPFDILAAFVKTFTNDEDVQTVKRIRKWAHCHKLEELLNATHPWPKTPEQVCN